MRYSRICTAIMKKCEEEKLDWRDFARKWIMLFEESRVVGWNRDEFLETMIKVKGGKTK